MAGAQMRMRFSVKGLAELDRALKELPKSTQGTVLRNALKRLAQPIAVEARARVRRKSGATARSIKVIALKKNDVGKAEFHAAMKAGMGTAAAVEAMKAARRRDKGNGAAIEVAVTTGRMPQAGFTEKGTSRQRAFPYMRPAFDSRAPVAVAELKRFVWEEIQKAVKRLAARAAREAAKIKGGS